MKVEDIAKNNILINHIPSKMNLEILIELVNGSTEIEDKKDILERWEYLKNLELKKYKDYELKSKIDLFRIEILVFSHKKYNKN